MPNLDPITRESYRKDKASRVLWDAYDRHDRREAKYRKYDWFAPEYVSLRLVKQARDLAGRLEAEVFG